MSLEVSPLEGQVWLAESLVCLESTASQDIILVEPQNLMVAAPQSFIPWATFPIQKELNGRQMQRCKVILSHVATRSDAKQTSMLILIHSYVQALHNYICTATQAHGHTLMHIPGSPQTHILRTQAHTHKHRFTCSYGNAVAYKLI